VGALGKIRAASGGKTVPILFAGPEGTQAVLLSGPKLVGEIFLVTAWVPDVQTEQNERFVKKYQEKFAETPDVQAAISHDNARLLFEALRQCQGTFTPGQIREKLAELKDFPMLTGNATFDDTGQLRRPAFVVRLGQGKAVTISRQESK